MLDFRGLLKTAEARGEVDRIRRPVSPRFEAAALMEQVERQRRVYAFDAVAGAKFPLVGGLLNRMDRFGWALGSEPGQPFTVRDLDARFEAAKARRLAPREVNSSPAKEVVLQGADADLTLLPVPTVFELDTGPFITAACGISRNPHTGEPNIGIYRVLVIDRHTIAINSSSLSDLGQFYRHNESLGQKMPIALAIGVEPALLMAATCKLPRDECEYDLAGALQGKAIDLIRCETSDLLVPANAEIIIEGEVDFSHKIRNTLGEFAGQYGTETAPHTRVTAINHRKDAMFYSILAGRNHEHTTLGSIATFDVMRSITTALKEQIPEIRDINVFLEPKFGSMAHIVIAIDKQDDAQPVRILDQAFRAAGGFFPVSHNSKRIIVVDSDVDVRDFDDVEWAVWTRTAAAHKYRLIPDIRSWELERCAKGEKGSLRLLIDATIDMEDRESLRRPLIPGRDAVKLADYLG